MTIITPPAPSTEEEFKAAKDAIMNGKFLSYIPCEGWAYRTMDEMSEDSKEYAKV